MADKTIPVLKVLRGNVGIGSTTPTSNLEVIASGADLENMLRVTSGTAGRGVYIGAPQSATVAGVIDFRNGNVATRYLDFRGEGTSRMVIQTDGKVGIGTTAPGYALDVPSGIVRGQEVRAKYGSNNLIQLTWGDTTSEGRLWIGNNGGATVLINGNSTSYINNGANFGVGTSTPTRVLQVNGAAHATSHLVGSLTTALGIAGSFPDANDSELGPGYLVMTRDDTAAAKQLQFWKNGSLHSGLMTDTNGLNFVGSDGAADVTIKTDGKVGIGYGQPDYTLKVAGDCYVRDATTLDGTVSVGGTANGLLYIKEDNGSNTIQLRADVSNSYNEIDSQKEFNIRTEAGALRFSTANTERMRILADGKVGIGTTAPGARLQIHATRTSSTNVAALILSDNVTGTQTNGVYKSIRSISNGSSSVSEIRFLETDGTNNNTSIAFATAAVAGGLTERMRINQSGSVGIGTTSPATTLDVNGVTTARDYIRLGASAVHGSLTWLSSSPARLILFGASGRKLSLGSNGAYDKVTLDLNGYVGIGNTSPNNDQNVTDRVQLAIGNTAQVGGRKTGTPSWFNISHGTYFDGTNWKYYSAADEAALVEGYNGGLYARMAVAGTNAGDNITWVTALTVLNTGYVHMDGASQVRLTLGSQGTAGANDANWIRGTGTSLGFNAAGGGFHWEVSGTQRMALDSSGNLTINGNISNTAASAYYYLNNVGTGNSGLYVAGLSSRMRFHVPASNYYEWEIGGAHKMRLDADGDLGIGTNGPTQKLHVFGNILFGSSSKLGFNNDINSFVIDGGGTYGIEIDGWYGASLQSRSVIGVFVDELGNVGIGPTATNPDATGSKLQISSGTTANAANKFYDLLKLKGKNNTLNAVGMLFSIESTAGAAAGLDYSKGGIVYGPTSGWGRGAMHFLQEASNTTADADISDSVMTILNDGNVGINDTTPTYKLDVNGTFRVTGAATFDSSIGFATVLAGNGSAAAPSFAFTSDTNTGMYRGATDRLSFSTGGTDSLVLTTSDASFVGHLAFAGYLYSSSTAGRLITNTVDGSDTKAFYVCGGGDAGQGRGAYVSVYGNDHASAPGLLELLSGNDGSIAMYSGGAERVTINNNGSIQYNGDTQQSWIQFKDAGTLSGYIGAGIGLAASPNNLNTDFAIRAKTKLALCTNDSNAAKVTILADGKVGIGTATPAVKLHLDSGATTELRIDGEGHELITFHKSSAQKGLVGYSIGDSTLKLCAGSGTIASNVNGISINANGNVGIGTATPSAELHVKSPINQHCFLNIDTTTAAYNPVLELKEAGTRRAYINYVSASNYLSITTEESGSDIALMPLAGSVGIGTATPDTKLHVYYASPSPTMASITRANLDNLGILVEDSSLDNNNGEITCGITFGYVGESSSAIASVDEGGSGASGLGFVTGTIASVAERLRITNNGNVGIGTAVPEYPLHISGADSAIYLVGSDQGRIILQDTGATSNSQAFDIVSKEDKLHFRRLNNGRDSVQATVMALSGDKVGIGTTSPDTKLHVLDSAAPGVSPYNSTGLTVENNGRANIHILHPNGSDGYLFFGDANAGNRAYVGHYGSTMSSANQMVFYSAGNFEFANGNVGIGTVTPAGRLHIIDGNVNLKMGDSVKRYTWHTSTGLTDGGGGTPQYYTIGTVDLTGLTYKNGYIKGTVTQGRSYLTNPLYNFTFFFKITTGDAEGMLSVDVEGFNNGWLNVYQDDSTSKIFKFVLYNNFSNQVGLTYDIEYYAGAGTSHIADSDVTFITSVSGASSASAPSGYTIIPKSFLNYKDFNTGQNTFGLGTNATKVGIGTQNPGALLHIEGGASEISTQQLKVSSVWGQTSTPMVLFENRHDGNGLKITNNAARSDAELFEITNSGGTVVMVKGDGSVGIGTNSPSQALHVKGQVNVTDASNASYGTLIFGNNTSRYIRGNSAEVQIGPAINQLHFLKTDGAGQIATSAANGTTAIQILARIAHTSGNILEVLNASTSVMTLDYAGALTVPSGTVTGTLNVNGSLKGNNGALYFTSTNYNSYFYNGSNAHTVWIYNGGTDSIKLRSDGDSYIRGGALGIGTASPARTLDVQGPASSDDVIAVRHASGGSEWLKLGFWNGTTERASIRTQDDKSHVSIFCSTTERMRIQSDGNVGIGTNAPSSLLDVRNGSVARHTIYAENNSAYGTPLYLNDLRSDTSMEYLTQFWRNSVLVGHIASDATHLRIGAPAGYVILDGADGTILRDSGTNKIIQNGSYFRPDANNNMYLGASAQRWAQVYSVQGNFSGTVTASALLNLSGTNYIHQLSGHNFVQGDATMTYLYGGSGGGQIRSTNNSSSLVQWLDNGKVGIGTTAPPNKLTIDGGNVEIRNGYDLMIRPSGNGNDFRLTALDTGGGDVVWGGATTTSIMRWANNGRVGIGTTAPEVKLTVRQSAQDSGIRLYGHSAHSGSYMNFRIDSAGHTNLETSGGSYTKFDIGSGYFNLTTAANEPIYMDLGGTFYWRDRDASNTVRMQLDSASGNLAVTGNVTISNDKILSVGTTNGNSGRIRFYGGSGTSYYMDYQPVGTNDRQFRFNGSSSASAYTTYFNQQGSGNHNLYVDGDITSAGTGRYIYAVNLNVTGYKNFEIEHPTKENMMLVHSSLEGPEAGVYYRGRAQSDTITLPDYWTGLVRDGTITVQLTPNGSFQHLYVVSTSLSEIKIGAAEGETIDCYYIIYGERADVAPLVVEDADAWHRFQERKAAMSDGKA